jgi:hypothetical protein
MRLPCTQAESYQEYTSQPFTQISYDASPALPNPLNLLTSIIQEPSMFVSTTAREQDQYYAPAFRPDITNSNTTQANILTTNANCPISDETLMALTEPFLMNWCLT